MRRALCVLVLAAMATMGLTGRTVASGDESCADCSNCIKNQQLGNKAFEGDDTSVHEEGDGLHSSCITSGGCLDQHPPTCFPETNPVATLDAIERALSEGDVSTLREIIQDSGGQFVFASERHAIQGVGCKGQINAHIPLGDLVVATDF